MAWLDDIAEWLYTLGTLAGIVLLYLLIRWLAVLLLGGRNRANPLLKFRIGLINRLVAVVILAVLLVFDRSLPQLQLVPSIWGERALMALLVVALGVLLSYLIDALILLYETLSPGRSLQIKSYIQLFKILLYTAVGLVAFAILTGQSVLYYISGLGAFLAVVMLVFRETILSFIATLQIQASDMVRPGDWIEAPAFGIDGEIKDIALHTVRVQNWDKTISTMPTASLVNTPLKNWRGMEQSGGRRIQRAIHIDMSSVRFLDDEEIERFGRFELLKDYIQAKKQELSEHNRQNETIGYRRRLTNLGTFRSYTLAFLHNHKGIHSGMTCMVRQRTPGPQGLPLEIYAFTNTTQWSAYEDIQADILDRLLAILPEFGLRTWQEALLGGLTHSSMVADSQKS